jgi:hypothetical protein
MASEESAPDWMMECDCQSPSGAWPFALPRHAGIFTVSAVVEQELPIALVAHTTNGWEALPEGGPWDPEVDGCFVCLSCLVRRNPSLKQVADLPVGWTATRDEVSDTWDRQLDEESGEDEEG